MIPKYHLHQELIRPTNEARNPLDVIISNI